MNNMIQQKMMEMMLKQLGLPPALASMLGGAAPGGSQNAAMAQLQQHPQLQGLDQGGMAGMIVQALQGFAPQLFNGTPQQAPQQLQQALPALQQQNPQLNQFNDQMVQGGLNQMLQNWPLVQQLMAADPSNKLLSMAVASGLPNVQNSGLANQLPNPTPSNNNYNMGGGGGMSNQGPMLGAGMGMQAGGPAPQQGNMSAADILGQLLGGQGGLGVNVNPNMMANNNNNAMGGIGGMGGGGMQGNGPSAFPQQQQSQNISIPAFGGGGGGYGAPAHQNTQPPGYTGGGGSPTNMSLQDMQQQMQQMQMMMQQMQQNPQMMPQMQQQMGQMNQQMGQMQMGQMNQQMNQQLPPGYNSSATNGLVAPLGYPSASSMNNPRY